MKGGDSMENNRMQVPNSGQFTVKATNQTKGENKAPVVEKGTDLRANKTNGTASL